MNPEKMEYLIYKEFKQNIENGLYNGIKVVSLLNSGEYLENMNCENLDKIIFRSVSSKIQQELQKSFIDEASKTPFPVKNAILDAKFGSSVYGVSINKKFLSNIDKKMEGLKKIIRTQSNKDQVLIQKLYKNFKRQSMEHFHNM